MRLLFALSVLSAGCQTLPFRTTGTAEVAHVTPGAQTPEPFWTDAPAGAIRVFASPRDDRNVAIRVTNSGALTIEIVWDKAVFVGPDGLAHKMVNGDTRVFLDHLANTNTIVPANATAEALASLVDDSHVLSLPSTSGSDGETITLGSLRLPILASGATTFVAVDVRLRMRVTEPHREARGQDFVHDSFPKSETFSEGDAQADSLSWLRGSYPGDEVRLTQASTKRIDWNDKGLDEATWGRGHIGVGGSLFGYEWGSGNWAFRLGLFELAGRAYFSPGGRGAFIGFGVVNLVPAIVAGNLLPANSTGSAPPGVWVALALTFVGGGYQWRIGRGAYLSVGLPNLVEYSW